MTYTPSPGHSPTSAESLLSAYLAGDCSREERELVEAWALADPDHARQLDAARVVWDHARSFESEAFDATELLERLQTVLDVEAEPNTLPPTTKHQAPRPNQRPVIRQAVYVTAAITVALCCLLAIVHLIRRATATRTAVLSTRYITLPGQRAQVALADGSIVQLNVASQLIVPPDYTSGHHTVQLVGEAVFDVSHHTGTPFTVVSGNQLTRVLGTNFLVRHYTADTTTTIAVRDGKVATGSVILTAAQQVTLSRTGAAHVQSADSTLFTFATGYLTLNDVPFSQAILDLSRWYDATIQLGDPTLATRRIKGGFPAGSLTDLTELLQWTFNLRVVQNGQTLTLYPK